jgi:hypothetical protein
MIDVQCSRRVPNVAANLRCQLLAGHEGAHAVMFCREGARAVRTWSAKDPTSVSDQLVGQMNRPWVPGLAQPAWSERR